MLRLSCLEPDSPNAVLCNSSGAGEKALLGGGDVEAEVKAQDERYAPYIGRRTTFRMLNKKHALKLLSLGRSTSGGHPKYRPHPGEAFLLWHYSSVVQAPKLAREFPDNRIYLLSSNLLNWQVDTYSAIRRDMYRLGLGPFPCYAALSSGVHGILAAMQLCDSVSVMGFSLDLGAVHQPVHFRPISEQPSAAHSWAFDTLLLRALHLTGHVQVCSS